MMNSRLSIAVRLVAACAIAASVGACDQGAAAAADEADKADAASVEVQTARVQRAAMAQPVRAYGSVAASASNVRTIDLPYVARITQLRVQAGQRIARGAPLVVVEADPAAVLAASQAKSALALAQGELARTQSLYDQGLATQSQLAAATKALQDAQQGLAAQDRTGVAAGAHTISSPVDGVVMQVTASQGDQVQAGAAIMQLADANAGKVAQANVALGVEPADAARIHAGDVVTLHGLSTALATSTVKGRIVMVGAAVDAQSQLVNVGANVPLEGTPFIPGTRVAADVDTQTATHWAVPRSAVLRDEHGAYVFQVTDQHKVQRVAVAVQVEADGQYGVDGALDGTRPIVVSGNYELKGGMTVRQSGGAAR
jgi:RND family efflux transporter MFP subunit